MPTVNVLADTLALAGVDLPPAGDSDRFRLVFPPSYEIQISNSGDDIASKNPATNATLTVSAYQTDALTLVMEAFYSQQLADDANPSARAPKPGACGLVLASDNLTQLKARWTDARVTQRSDLVSARNGTVVTWTLNLSRVVTAVS